MYASFFCYLCLILTLLWFVTSLKLEDDVDVVVVVEKAHKDSSVTLRLLVSGLIDNHFVKGDQGRYAEFQDQS